MSIDELTDDGIKTNYPDVTMADYIDIHGEPVYQGDDRVVFADSEGYEWNEWTDALGVSRSELSQKMHDLAYEVYGRDEADGVGDPWAGNYPVVFDAETFEEDE